MNRKKRLFQERSMKLYNQTQGNIHWVETMGTFDGPGLRYVLFLQGCPFQCQYCHNRDTWSTRTNRLMTVQEVLTDYTIYGRFYKKGGLTVSGGEPLLQLRFVIDLFHAAKDQGVHTCLDTSAALFNPRDERYLELISYTDLVLLDIKHMDPIKHQSLTGSRNDQVLAFARFLDANHIKTIIRYVLVPGLTDHEEDLIALRSFLDGLSNVVGIDVLPYHRSGIYKWKELGQAYPLEHIHEPKQEDIHRAEQILKRDYRFMK